jgi:hypothetical protein
MRVCVRTWRGRKFVFQPGLPLRVISPLATIPVDPNHFIDLSKIFRPEQWVGARELARLCGRTDLDFLPE